MSEIFMSFNQSGRTVEELVGEIMRRMEGLYDNSFIQRVGDLGDYGKIEESFLYVS